MRAVSVILRREPQCGSGQAISASVVIQSFLWVGRCLAASMMDATSVEMAFGLTPKMSSHVEKMAALYAPDIRWSLPASLPYPHPMTGRDAARFFACAEVGIRIAMWLPVTD